MLRSGRVFMSFVREVLNLSRLKSLERLSLSDPSYADNLVCTLCNYQTHMIYHLPELETLDTLKITDEFRRVISATMLKKRM